MTEWILCWGPNIIWIHFIGAFFSQAVQREEQLQMACFKKPQAQNGSLSAVCFVYKLQREAAVSTPLWKQRNWCQQDVQQTADNQQGEESRKWDLEDKAKHCIDFS